MNTNAINVMKKLARMDHPMITSPEYLGSKFAGKSSEQIKIENKKEKDEQFPRDVQVELSLRGQRTAFIEFHRFMFAMTDIEIQQLKKAYKKFYAQNRSDEYVYTDVSLLNDAIDYQICIRSADGFDIKDVSLDVLQSWNHNRALAEDYPEITSEHMINLALEVKKH